MAEEILLNKLKIKAKEEVLLLNAPATVAAHFQQTALHTQAATNKHYATVLLFVCSQAELTQLAPTALTATAAEGKLWIAYPKKSSTITTDINRDTGWLPLTSVGWGPVTQIAVDETWSALRFKPEGKINRQQPRLHPTAGAGKQQQRPELVVPDYLQRLFEQHPTEKEFFDALAYTHRKEYLQWVTEAKRPETRERRLEQLLQLLAQGKKNKLS